MSSFIVDNLNKEIENKVDSYFNNIYNYNSDSDSEDDNSEDKDNNENNEKEIIIGIDLGTTNSCVSIWRNKNLEIIPDIYGNKTIPSFVAFTNKTKYIGRDAKNQSEINAENTFYEIKRLIGRKYDDPTIENDKPFLSFNLGKDDKNNVIIKPALTGRREYTPEELSALILLELKLMAEDYLKKPVEKAVITVPAYFNDAQRQATKDASTIAGLECVRIINEPTSAALAYGLERVSINKNEDINVIIYDLGGGTLDCSLLNISNGVFEVLASTGNTHLGGSDFDNRLIGYCMNEFKRKNQIAKLESLPLMSLQKLKKSCENAKKILSVKLKTYIMVKDFYENKHLMICITRKLLEKICRDLLILCLKPVEDVLKSCNMDRDEIDEIILVGGVTRMPAIRNNLKLFFKGKEPNASINPDEVVSAGAAIQGYIISNKTDPFSESIVLLDRIPLSLGVETIGGIMTTLISRNSVIPIKRTKKFTTDSDWETSVIIKIYEGERELTKDNFFVGEFELSGIESAPRGIAKIEVTFSIDINGIINVSATDIQNKNKESITITGNKGRLSSKQIIKLIEEAKKMEIIDKKNREKKQMFYEIEDLCSNITINIANDEFKLKEKDKNYINEDIKKIVDWLKQKNFLDRRRNEYVEILKKIKEKYGTLILRISHKKNDLKCALNENIDEIGTTIFGRDDEKDPELLLEEIESLEYNFSNDMNEKDKKELKMLNEQLVELCYSIFDIASSKSLLIEDNHKQELKDYLNDILLWTHVKEKISKIEYMQKIDEVNNTCNEIMKTYHNNIFDENEITKNIKTKRAELEQLCYALKSSIASNLFSIEEEKIKNLDAKLNEILNWLIEYDLNKKKAELKNIQFEEYKEKNYQDKIDELNDCCDTIWNDMIGINIYQNIDIIDNIIALPLLNELNNSNIHGTTIDSLKQKLK